MSLRASTLTGLTAALLWAGGGAPSPAQAPPRLVQAEAETELLVQQGREQLRAFELTAAQATFEQLLAIYRTQGDRRGEATALTLLGETENELGYHLQARATLTNALAIYREDGGDRTGEAAALNNLGEVQSSLGEYQTALTTLQQALAMQREQGDSAGEAETLTNLGVVYLWLEQLPAAVEALEAAIALYQAQGDAFNAPEARAWLGFVRASDGDAEAGLTLLAQALADSRAAGNRRVEIGSAQLRGLAHLNAEQPELALAAYEQVLPVVQALDVDATVGVTLMFMGDAHGQLGNAAAAIAHYEQALQLYAQQAGEASPAWLHARLAIVYAQQGEFEPARANLTTALVIAEQAALPKLQADLETVMQTLTEVEHSQATPAPSDANSAVTATDRRPVITGTLDTNSETMTVDDTYFQTHDFTGRAGETVAIELSSTDFDAYLILVAPDGNKLAENDDYGSGSDARIALELPVDGVYRVVVNTYTSGETGDYRLSWQPATAEDLQLQTATELSQQAVQLRDEGDVAAAVPLAERSLALRQEIHGDEHPDIALSLHNLATLYDDQSRFDEAEPLYEQAIAMRRRLFPDGHPDLTVSLNNFAGLHTRLGRHDEAIALYQEALAMRRQMLGDEHPDVASGLNNLAFVYDEQGRYEEAEALYQEVLAMLRRLRGDEHLQIATALNNLAGVYLEQGRYAEAEPLHQESLAMRRRLLGDDHPDIAISLNNLAFLHDAQGRYEEAERFYEEAIAIRRHYDPEHPEVATNLNNLASLYATWGRYEEAEALYQESLAMRRRLFGEEHPDVALGLNNLAFWYTAQGRYDAAESHYQAALAINRRLLGDEHPSVATNLSNLAALYSSQGRDAEAEALYRETLAMRRRILGEAHPDVALSLNNLAHWHMSQQRYEEAESLQQAALAIFRQHFAPVHPYIATSLSNLAVLYDEQGRYDEAETMYHEALAMRRRLFGEAHPDIALSLNNWAEFYRIQGDYAEAEPLYEEAIAMYSGLLDDTHPTIAVSRTNLASNHIARGELRQGLVQFAQSLAIEENNLATLLTTGSERQKRDYFSTIARSTDLAVSLHLQEAPQNSEAAQLAFTTVLRRKGRILDAVTDNVQILRQNLSPENQALLEQLSTKRRELATAIFNPSANLTPAYRRRVARLKGEANTLESELARRSAAFRTTREPVTLDAIQARVPDDAALVEIIRYQPADFAAPTDQRWGEPQYAAYILTASGEPRWVALGAAETIDAAIVAFRRQLIRRHLPQRLRRRARALDALVMEPIRAQLGDVQHLLLSPDSQLNLVPFAALVDENDDYLIENYQITYLSTGRDLRRPPLTAAPTSPPLILANPDYDAPGVAIANAPRHPQRRATERRSRDLATLRVSPLPGTAAEADALRTLLPDATILTENQATENALKQAQAPEILHVATHGFFLSRVEQVAPADLLGGLLDQRRTQASAPASGSLENPLLRAGLTLAGFNPRQSGNEDGALTALEVASLNLHGTRLAVLSACETGLGEVANGEGIYGLRRALAIAGSESQVISLWKVDDEGTKDLMVDYYQRLLAGAGRSEALRQVQLAMLNREDYAHPFYWAAFIPSGDWRPLR